MNRFPCTLIAVAALGALSPVSSAVAAEEEIALLNCPAAVQKILGETGTVRTVVKFIFEDGVFLYEADVKSGSGSQIDIVVTAEGKVVKKSESVKLAACPEEVRKTFEEKAAGKQLGRIYFATDAEGNSYHAEITSKVDLTIGANNIFDVKPPLVGSNIGPTSFDSGNTYPSTYDSLGRSFAASVKVHF